MVLVRFDLVSRESMLRGLFSVQGGEAILPFVHLFYGVPSTYMWQDNSGDIHEVYQGQGGEQGDALMPALFCLGQHYALAAVQQGVGRERTVVRVSRRHLRLLQSRQNCPDLQHTFAENCGCIRASKSIWGKPKFGTEEESSPQDGRGWPQMPKRLILMQLCGGATAHFLSRIKGLLVLGTSLGSPEFVDKELGKVASKQQMLLNRIPHVSDMQCAWLLLLFCASPHPNYILRMHLCTSQFAIRHDDSVKRCFEQSPQTDETTQTCRW